MPERHDTPVTVGQEWEVQGGTTTYRACVLSRPFLAQSPGSGDDPVWNVAVATDIDLGPMVTTCDRLRTAGRLIGYPAGHTLELARAMRAKGQDAIDPAALHESAQGEVPEDAQNHTLEATALYGHALHEAGALVDADTGEPFPTCRVCAFPASEA